MSWLDQQPATSVWTTAVNVLEIRHGLQLLPTGKRQSELSQAFDAVLQRVLDNRVASLDAAAEEAAYLMAVRHRAGGKPDCGATCSFFNRYNRHVSRSPRRRARQAGIPRSAAGRLREAERLYRDFVELTPYRFTPFVKSFDSFEAYERWKRAQTNPWYR